MNVFSLPKRPICCTCELCVYFQSAMLINNHSAPLTCRYGSQHYVQMLLYSFIWLLSLLFFVKIGLSIVTSDTLNCPRLFILIKSYIQTDSNPAIPTGLMEKHNKNLLQCQIFLCFLTVLFSWRKFYVLACEVGSSNT